MDYFALDKNDQIKEESKKKDTGYEEVAHRKIKIFVYCHWLHKEKNA